MVDDTMEFLLRIPFSVDNFIYKKRADNAKFNTDLTVQAVYDIGMVEPMKYKSYM